MKKDADVCGEAEERTAPNSILPIEDAGADVLVTALCRLEDVCIADALERTDVVGGRAKNVVDVNAQACLAFGVAQNSLVTAGGDEAKAEEDRDFDEALAEFGNELPTLRPRVGGAARPEASASAASSCEPQPARTRASKRRNTQGDGRSGAGTQGGAEPPESSYAKRRKLNRKLQLRTRRMGLHSHLRTPALKVPI